jgi:two-component system, LytTR family, sensor kinase
MVSMLKSTLNYFRKYGKRDAVIILCAFLISGYGVFYAVPEGLPVKPFPFFVQIFGYMVLIAYLHNLVLIRLFDQKKYLFYGFLVAGVIFGVSWVNLMFLPEKPFLDQPPIAFSEYVMTIFFVQAVGFMLLMSHRYFIEKQDYLQNQVLLRDMELKTLKAQVNPHFLFNAFNSLYGQIVEKTGDPASTVLKLSDLMHYQLSVHQRDRMPLGDELQHLKNYIDLEKMRWGDRLDIDFQVEGRADGLLIEPLLLLPFVENAFKHGVESLREQANVVVHIAVQKKTLHLFVENGRPETLAVLVKTSGTGLENVRRRLDLAYFEKYDLNIDTADAAFFRVALSIKLT